MFRFRNYVISPEDCHKPVRSVILYDYNDQVPAMIKWPVLRQLAGAIKFLDNRVLWVKVQDDYLGKGLSKVLYDSFFLFEADSRLISLDNARNFQSNRAWDALAKTGKVTQKENDGVRFMEYCPEKEDLTPFLPVLTYN